MSVEVNKFARVTVDVEEFCGGFDSWKETVYGLEFNGETMWLCDLKEVINTPSEFRRYFLDRPLVEFIGLKHRTSGSMGNEPDTKGEFITGFLFQIATKGMECEQTGQGGELVIYEMPLNRLPTFRKRLNKLLDKLRGLKFVTTNPDNEDDAIPEFDGNFI